MPNFIPTDEQWQKMKQFIKSDKYKKEDFFVFETLAVGDKIVPNRYIKIMPELLNTMMEDAKRGVSLMLNHNWSQSGVQSIPIGKVFDARIDGASQLGETTTLYTTQYILRDDSKVDGYSKNDIINLIESGTLADTSIGWGTTSESYKCSICHHSIYDFKHCSHIPGKKYIVDEETGASEQCIIEAHSPNELHAGNNVLIENSIVFDGAYPNAIIQSAIGENIENSENGLKALNEKEKLDSSDLVLGFSTPFGGINLMYKQIDKKGGPEKMENENEVVEEVKTEEVKTEETTEEVVETPNETSETTEATETEAETTAEPTAEEKAEAVVEEAVAGTTEEVATQSVDVDAEIMKKFGFGNNVEELIMLAKEGLANRQEVMAKALESGVHSMGNSFNKDIFAKTFNNMATKDIKEMGEAWENQAKELFGKGKVSKNNFSEDNSEKFVVDFNHFKTC